MLTPTPDNSVTRRVTRLERELKHLRARIRANEEIPVATVPREIMLAQTVKDSSVGATYPNIRSKTFRIVFVDANYAQQEEIEYSANLNTESRQDTDVDNQDFVWNLAPPGYIPEGWIFPVWRASDRAAYPKGLWFANEVYHPFGQVYNDSVADESLSFPSENSLNSPDFISSANNKLQIGVPGIYYASFRCLVTSSSTSGSDQFELEVTDSSDLNPQLTNLVAKWTHTVGSMDIWRFGAADGLISVTDLDGGHLGVKHSGNGSISTDRASLTAIWLAPHQDVSA